jgi:ankyrin repeat protein
MSRLDSVSKVKRLLAEGADLNGVDENGFTLLSSAASRGHVECVTILINAKADVNKTDAYGWTPLHVASVHGDVECVRLLIQHKANVNALTACGGSPLHWASTNGHLACVRILVAAGTLCERDRPNKYDNTPLAFAIKRNHHNVAEFLLHSGAKMKNVHPQFKIPYWLADIIAKRRSVMSSTLALKGVLKRRWGISKDVTNLIALYFWSERLK